MKFLTGLNFLLILINFAGCSEWCKAVAVQARRQGLKALPRSNHLIITIMKTISMKTIYVKTDGWRGYEQPLNAVAGANDTGTWSDSPCPTGRCLKELNYVKQELRNAKIHYRSAVCPSSNIFCAHRYVCVSPDDREKALRVVQAILDENITDLLYLCDN